MRYASLVREILADLTLLGVFLCEATSPLYRTLREGGMTRFLEFLAFRAGFPVRWEGLYGQIRCVQSGYKSSGKSGFQERRNFVHARSSEYRYLYVRIIPRYYKFKICDPCTLLSSDETYTPRQESPS